MGGAAWIRKRRLLQVRGVWLDWSRAREEATRSSKVGAPMRRGGEWGYSQAGGQQYPCGSEGWGRAASHSHPAVCHKTLCTACQPPLNSQIGRRALSHFREESRGSERESVLLRTPSTEARLGFAPRPGRPILPGHSWVPSWFCWPGDQGLAVKSL